MVNQYDNLEDVLALFESREEHFYEIEVAETIRVMQRQRDGDTIKPTYEELAELIAFDLAETESGNNDRWDTYYGPRWIVPQVNGFDKEVPAIEEITEGMLDYWKRRTEQARHPRLKVRYAGLVWDLSNSVLGQKADIKFAQMLIDETVNLFSNKYCAFACDAQLKLKRALSLALSIRDCERVNLVCDAIIQYEHTISIDDQLGTWGLAYDLIIKGQPKLQLPPERETTIINELESRLERCAKNQPPALSPWSVEHAALRLASYYKDKNQEDDLHRVMEQYAQTWLIMSRETIPILGMTWLDVVYKKLKKFELKEQADQIEPELRSLGTKSHENMVKTTHSMQFTVDEIEAFASEMVSGTLSDTLIRIAQWFLPDPHKERDFVLNVAKQSPTYLLFSRRILGYDGRVVAEVGSLEDDLEGHIILQIEQDIRLKIPFLRLVIERTLFHHNPTVEVLCDFIYQSPAFPCENHRLIERGLRAYLVGDFVAAIHILIPQIEVAARHLMEAVGGPVYEIGKRRGYNLRNLDKLLSSPQLEKILSDRITLYMRIILTDQRGWNVRNSVSHGLFMPDAFGSGIADRVFHVLLLLSLVREEIQEEVNQPVQ